MVSDDSGMVVSGSAEDDLPSYKVIGSENPVADEDSTEIESKEVEPKEAEVEAKEEVPEYTPDFKYKAADSEKEVPEYLRGLMTSKEMEDQIKDILSKADGLDVFKSRHEQKIQEYNQLNEQYGKKAQEYDSVIKGLNVLQHYADNDLDTFFKEAKIPREKVINTVKEWLDYEQMSPSDRQRYDSAKQYSQQAFVQQQQNQMLKAQNDQLMQQQYNYFLDQSVNQPLVSDFASDYDSRVGRQGAFREQVDRAFKQDHSLKTLQDAAFKTIEYFKPLMGYTSISQQQASPSQPAPKTIPNLGQGRASASPTKKAFSSFDDMKKFVKEKLSENYE